MRIHSYIKRFLFANLGFLLGGNAPPKTSELLANSRQHRYADMSWITALFMAVTFQGNRRVQPPPIVGSRSLRSSASLPLSRLAAFFRAPLIVCAVLLWPMLASAAVSPYCPTQSLTVANGGSVTSNNLAACDGPFNGAMGGPFPGFRPVNGTVVLGLPTGPGNQTVTYTHNGTATTTDTFALEDENGDTLTFNVTITPPTSSIVVSPTSLSVLTAGTSLSQTLTSCHRRSRRCWVSRRNRASRLFMSSPPSSRPDNSSSSSIQTSCGALCSRPTTPIAPPSARLVRSRPFRSHPASSPRRKSDSSPSNPRPRATCVAYPAPSEILRVM